MIDRTNHEIRDSAGDDLHRSGAKRRRSALLRTIDGLLWELEELNLRGRDRVPARVRRQSEVIFASIRGAAELEARYRVPAMMDVLYTAQELIFKEIDPDYRGEGEDEEENSA